MAKYSKKAQDKVGDVMHEYKQGKLKSGKGGKGGKVKNRKQAIAIGLSEARESGAKVPEPKKTSSKPGRASNGKKSPKPTGKRSSGRKKSSSKKR